MEVIAHLIIFIFSSYIILSANPGSSLFSWHPTCMVLAWSLFTEGVILFRRPSAGWRVVFHWALQALGLTFAISGFLAIYKNKEDSNKDHFVTYHGLVGAFTLIFLMIQAAGGNIAKYSSNLKNLFPFIKPAVIKWGHRSSGSLALIATTTTLFLALFSLWFGAVTGESRVIWWSTAAAIFYPVTHILKNTYF